MEVNGAPELLCFPHSSEYLPLCSAEQRHFHFWVNNTFIKAIQFFQLHAAVHFGSEGFRHKARGD